MNINIGGNLLELLPEKAVLIPSEKIMIIADLHLGKIEHFRAAGINLPLAAATQTENRLVDLIEKHHPSRVIFLGDLFHSVQNQSYNTFQNTMSLFKNITFNLVIGNHDIMDMEDYTNLGITVYEELFINELWLTHEPQDEIKNGYYNLAGHIHPGVTLKGKGRQKMTLPCFYFGINNGLLPAFGYFTGKAIIKIEKKSDIFAIAEDKVFRINTE
ncbi:MAG TPA: ligase-associated DNA damage response endonuclease PdeM [Saprospiraceae bacterium]|nr:ligase-associated DNA damage response endonuclease PdeM [Saprospiraceae bacterium]